MYRFADAALLRAAAHPPGWVVTCWPDLDEDTVAQWRDWTRQVWADDHVAAAVAAASPGLAQRLRAVCEGRATDRRRVRRAVASLVAYLLRMQHRATPFGLFAGVAPVRVAAAAEVRWGVSHRAAARPDAVWLAEAVQRLEGCSDLLWRLTVVAQDGCVIRGDRLVLPWAPAEPDRPEPAEVGVRHTPAVRTALCTARTPVPFADLAAVLADAHPGVALGTVRELLGELVRRRFLITSLRPPMTATDPLGHLVAVLEDADADTLPAAAPVVAELRAARRPTRLRGVDSGTPPARAVPGSAAELRSEAADLLLDCTLTLPAAVAAEAARAATLLARLSPFPTGSPAWRDYHARFLERYGPGALVRVGDLTDPCTGLGLPAGYRGSAAASPDSRIGARDERLLCWAQHAALTGTREITLDAGRLSELAAEPPTQAIPHADVRFHLHAPTRRAVDGGAFSLVVNGISSSAGITAGRFLDLLPAADRQRMTRAYATAPTLDAGAVGVQVSSPPLYPRTERVARAPAVLPRILHLGELPGADVSAPALRDLAVGADVHRLFLVDLTDGTLVEPRVFNAVEPVNTTHPLVRFLCELPRARAAALAPFSWGAARRLPFLPRIRCGRTVLAQARWRVAALALPGPTAPAAHWAAALKALRTQTNVPTAVVLVRAIAGSAWTSTTAPTSTCSAPTWTATATPRCSKPSTATPTAGWTGAPTRSPWPSPHHTLDPCLPSGRGRQRRPGATTVTCRVHPRGPTPRSTPLPTATSNCLLTTFPTCSVPMGRPRCGGSSATATLNLICGCASASTIPPVTRRPATRSPLGRGICAKPGSSPGCSGTPTIPRPAATAPGLP